MCVCYRVSCYIPVLYVENKVPLGFSDSHASYSITLNLDVYGYREGTSLGSRVTNPSSGLGRKLSWMEGG